MKHFVRVGDRFSRLTVISDPVRKNRSRWVDCKCDCGTEKPVNLYTLVKGQAKSCGCLKKEILIKRSTTHGDKSRKNHSRLYKTWIDMKDRCENPVRHNYNNYGGRGIFVCDEWRFDYIAFKTWAIRNGYTDNLQINRVDNNLPYTPDNCNWVTNQVNCRNRRSNRMITAFEETRCLVEWVEDNRCSISYTALIQRINSGWTAEFAITDPPLSKKR